MAKLASPPPNAGEAVAPALAELQAAFQRAVVDGDDTVLDGIMDNSRTDRNVLFGVYRHAYASRLVEIVRNDHPCLSAHLGEAEFQRLAREYIAANPSRTQNARWFARALPEFLFQAEGQRSEIGELAAIERIANDAFDAADAPTLTLADLAAFDVESWDRLVFVAHPSAGHRTNGTNAYALWQSLKDGGAAPAPIQLDAVEFIVGWRRDTTPVLRRMGDEEAMMWNEASKGVPFGALCELVAVFDDPETAPMRAAQYLQQWINDGMLTAAHLTS